ncbi:MAG: OmpA family protein [Cocleimonas sp.]|nr:OmpA family protein [Cocleimonas sp.]
MKNLQQQIKKAMISRLKQATLISISLILVSGCSSTDTLYAKYDDNCDIPKPKVKIVERVVEKVKIQKEYVTQYKTKYKTKIKYKTKYKTKIKYITKGSQGIHWEPAVYFGFDKSILTVVARQRLNEDIRVLKKYRQLTLSVQSFTDQKGSNRYNRKLALKRQQAVISFLVSQGIKSSRIRVSPLGEELPILGQSKQERSINRRVELMLLDNTGRPLALDIQPKPSPFKPPLPMR